MSNISAKPFVKWAGGKRQLIPEIDMVIEKKLNNGELNNYVEPFVGAGAIFFHVEAKYDFEEYIINDINTDLINLYLTIKNNLNELLYSLEELDKKYKKKNELERKSFFYDKRDEFNNINEDILNKSSLFIFLNKTCFNGLYRVNKKGKFNVPSGKYKNPKILDEENLKIVSQKLQKVRIFNKDFEEIGKYIDENSLVYLDPPYRPISSSSSFKSYQSSDFNDKEQKRLADFYTRLSNKDAALVLSNSDPKNNDKSDNFFDDLYGDFKIKRIEAKRSINSKAKKRGKIKELLIHNY